MASATDAASSMASANVVDNHVDTANGVQVSDVSGTTPQTEVWSLFQTNATSIPDIHNGSSWGFLHSDAVELVAATWD